MRLDRLYLGRAMSAYPERWERGDPLTNTYKITAEGDVVVRSEESEDGHVVTLTTLSNGEHYGRCSCDGFKFNDGPCSHLCAVFRAWESRLLDLPRYRPVAIKAERVKVSEERAEGAV